MNKPLVFVVVLNWNHLEDLRLTMESLLKQDYPNMQILISDNGSTDGSQSFINKNYPKVILLENNDNLGWAAGNNVGIKYAINKNADYILLANNDLYFENDKIISILVNNLIELKDKKINIIGTNVNYFSSKNKLHNAGWIMYPESVKKGKVFNKFRKEYKFELPPYIKTVDFVSGCFILIDKVVFDKIGFIDEAFFIYGEETEFSLRAWSVGCGSVTNTNLTIYHKVSATNKVGSPFSMYLKTRNVIYLLRKHKSIIPDINYFIVKYYFGFVKVLIKEILFPQNYSGKQLKVIYSTIKGFLDGVIFRVKGKNGIKF
ncbi:MAG: glycosyltransferase family 2 protein [Paludibacter sp.]